MPKIHVEKSIEINAPIATVYKAVADFHTWTTWSPWLIMEPEATVEVNKDGKYYEWKGNRVGSGNMEITAENPNEQVDYNLAFLTPFKSKAKVQFRLAESEKGTTATWYMDSSLPFFMFWMKKAMTGYIGMDYERGLYLLKDYCENHGHVHSKLNFIGIQSLPERHFVGVRTETDMAHVGPAMERDLTQLEQFLKKQHSDKIGGNPFSIYHKWDIPKNLVAYTSAFPVTDTIDQLPEGFIQGALPKLQAYGVKHTGPYHHLGNAWSTLYSMHRGKEFKPLKGQDPFEVYENDPAQTPPNELVTTVYFPVRA